MDSGNSGSISSSDEEYDSSSHADPSSSLILNQFSSISHPQQPSLVPSMFDLSSTYLHALSHPNPNLLNLDSHHQGPRSEPNCTLPQSLPSSSSSAPTPNQYFSGHDNIIINATTQFSSSPQTPTNNNNVIVRNSKKRSRASRRAPTTVLTTDTTNFRSMVQEFTGIPAPPFSPSFSRRVPLRPNPLLSSSSSSSRTTLLHNNNTINVFSPNNNNNNNSINYQLLPDLSLPYHPHNNNLMQLNHPIPSFHPTPSSLHSLIPQGFGVKSLPNMLPVDDHAHVMGADGHEHVVNSEGMLLRSVGDGERSRDPFNNSYGGGCKLNMSVSASSSMNHEKNMEKGNSARESGGAVEAWVCSSDQ